MLDLVVIVLKSVTLLLNYNQTTWFLSAALFMKKVQDLFMLPPNWFSQLAAPRDSTWLWNLSTIYTIYVITWYRFSSYHTTQCDKKDSSSDSANRKEETFLLFRLWGIEITAVDIFFIFFTPKLMLLATTYFTTTGSDKCMQFDHLWNLLGMYVGKCSVDWTTSGLRIFVVIEVSF